MNDITIKKVSAREAFSDSGYPAVEVTVTLSNGEQTISNITESPCTSSFRPKYLYDKEQRFKGYGVQKAANIINTIIAPEVEGLSATNQALVDATIKDAMEKNNIGDYVNVSSPVSVAVFKGGAIASNRPMHRYIGGQSAFTLPLGGHLCASGSKRYNKDIKSQGKPTYLLVAYDFETFSDAHYALWQTANIYEKLLAKKYGFLIHRGFSMSIPAGKMDSDEFLWKVFVESIEKAGYTGKVGVYVDIGANDYYNREKDVYEGLFSAEPKTAEDLFEIYKKMTKEYPFVILQDPLEENDIEGFKDIKKNIDAVIVGDDLFSSNVERIKQCVKKGCVDSILLSVNRFSTVSDAIEVVRMAKNYGVDVLPRDLCGESLDVAAYAVGFNAGIIYEGGLDINGNELLLLEKEIGERVKFMGRTTIKTKKVL